MRLPTRLDRYPAKMVSHLAERLIERYASGAERVLDPFCGSGAVLVAAHQRGIPASGIDVNPLAELLSRVKLHGFDREGAARLASRMIEAAEKSTRSFPINWPNKDYWFTPVTLAKFERLRAVCRDMDAASTDEGIAVLLSLALSVRPCSRADQRSPKPFISKHAKLTRKGRHFDPYRTMSSVVKDLSRLYTSFPTNSSSLFLRANLATDKDIPKRVGRHSHVITSPPYINAQDYFRNSKLELHVLESLLPFSVDDLREEFLGGERGNLLADVPDDFLEENYESFPPLRRLAQDKQRLAAVVHRYLHDMSNALDTVAKCLQRKASLVLVCGDNLVGGIRIPTWQLLRDMIEQRGFRLFDQFSDPISDRMLPPTRLGHKGLIKEEVVCAFQRL